MWQGIILHFHTLSIFMVYAFQCLIHHVPLSFPLFWNSVAAKVWWTRRRGILLDTFHIAISFSSTRRINLLCPSLLSPALVQCLHPHEGVLSSFRDTVSFSQTLSSILLQSFKVTIASHWISNPSLAWHGRWDSFVIVSSFFPQHLSFFSSSSQSEETLGNVWRHLLGIAPGLLACCV